MRDSRPAFFHRLVTWEFATPGPADQQLSLCQGPQVTSGGVLGVGVDVTLHSRSN